MQVEQMIAFVTKTEPPGLEIRINFGVFAGRDATGAEIDGLARVLAAEVGEFSIVSEERHEFAGDVEASLHQVRIEIPGEHIPDAELEQGELRGRLVAAAEQWAQACIAERHSDAAGL
jgi:hypothetical protein